MKRLLTTAAITFGLLTGTAAHAAPTCHQKVTVAGLEYIKDTVPVSTKVSKMVREQALDLISSSADDYHAKALAYVTAVATATADVMKAAVTDEIKDLAAQIADTMVTSFGQTDKYQKDPQLADGVKNGAISNARLKIITAFFACKPTPPLPDSAMAVEPPKDTAKTDQPEAKAPPLPGSAIAVERPKDTAKAEQPEVKAPPLPASAVAVEPPKDTAKAEQPETVAKTDQQEKGNGKVAVDEEGFGKVTIEGVKMTFLMGKKYDPDDKYEDDEPNFTSVRNVNVFDDRGTFLAAVETLEKRCRTESDPMNVDLDKFNKLKADWLKNKATAANYKKASKEFKSIRIKPIEDQDAKDFDWQTVCGEVNRYVMELKIFKHLPDADWSKYEEKTPAWMNEQVSGTYPYIDQVKFISYKFRRQLTNFCSSAPKISEDNWRLMRTSRLKFTAMNANAEQTKDINHYLALMDQAKQRVEWDQSRDGDITRLARFCREYEALVSNVNTNAAPAQNLPMDKIASLYLVGIALRDVQCPSGAAVVRNALEFARQNGKTEDDVRSYADANHASQLRALTPSVEWSRNAGVMDRSLKLYCDVAARSSLFLGLPNPK